VKAILIPPDFSPKDTSKKKKNKSTKSTKNKPSNSETNSSTNTPKLSESQTPPTGVTTVTDAAEKAIEITKETPNHIRKILLEERRSNDPTLPVSAISLPTLPTAPTSSPNDLELPPPR
jgi:hypothetical protein